MSSSTLLSFQDDATVESLSAQDKHGDVQCWVHRLHAWLFEGDLFAGVANDAKLMRIHSTAEEFDYAAEETLIPFQVPCMPYHSTASVACRCSKCSITRLQLCQAAVLKSSADTTVFQGSGISFYEHTLCSM